jgi:hypothetical protein
MNARPKRTQGRVVVPCPLARLPRGGSAATAATAAPHSWQNFEPGVRATPQELQFASRTTAPHCVQYFPAAGDPQDGQGMVSGAEDRGVVTGEGEGCSEGARVRRAHRASHSIATWKKTQVGCRRLRRGHPRSMLPAHATGTLRTTGATLVRSAPHHGIGCQLRHSREFHARNSWRI